MKDVKTLDDLGKLMTDAIRDSYGYLDANLEDGVNKVGVELVKLDFGTTPQTLMNAFTTAITKAELNSVDRE